MENIYISHSTKPIHDWLRKISVAFAPGAMLTPLLEHVAERLVQAFAENGHRVQETPDAETDLILTSAPFLQPLNWREALLFTVRRRFGLEHTPTILTLIHARPEEFERALDDLEAILRKEPPDASDFTFPGLAPASYQTLIEQGRRGGAILALERVLQAQAKSIRILLLVGEEQPQEAYLFDLVGAYPRIEAGNDAAFYEDIVLRVVTALSTREVTKHLVAGDPIPAEVWRGLTTPKAMLEAARQLGRRRFFTHTVHVAHLVNVPAVGDVVAEQYSEGCFATWEPSINALISTITGSARPVDKDNITEDELAVIVGVRPDGEGALVRHVEGRRNDPPSSEAVEMMAMDEPLPRVPVPVDGRAARSEVPVARSKLHGHRGVAAYHPAHVEFVPLDPPYYHYPVTCATEAQAHGIRGAFARAEALQNPADPRRVAFTVLPGHGVVMVEKWQADKAPFQLIWEFMDADYLQIEPRVPQGPMIYQPGDDGRMHLHTLD
jgi:hypothetical protein